MAFEYWISLMPWQDHIVSEDSAKMEKIIKEYNIPKEN
jgi:hypothetical protein